MVSLTIKAGEVESPPFTLANRRLSTVYSSGYPTETPVSILVSHDGKDYGLLHKGKNIVTFGLYQYPSATAFDPNDFNGIQFFKFLMPEAPAEALCFHIHIMDT